MKIYVASSWRNPWQPAVVGLLRSLGHDVYDFREPIPGDNGFHWSEVDPEWRQWTAERYRKGLKHEIARRGFKSDADALQWADACVAVQPYGTSTAIEVGWAAGAGKRTSILFPIGMPVTAIGGHSVDENVRCDVCVSSPCGTCALPGRLRKVEPELMVLLADALLIGEKELTEWATDDWPRKKS